MKDKCWSATLLIAVSLILWILCVTVCSEFFLYRKEVRWLTSQMIQTSSKYLFLGYAWPLWWSRKNRVCPHFTRLCRRTGNLTSHSSPSLSWTLCQLAVKKVVSKTSRLKNWPGPCEQLLPLFLKRNWKTSVRKLTFIWHPFVHPHLQASVNGSCEGWCTVENVSDWRLWICKIPVRIYFIWLFFNFVLIRLTGALGV